jgi:5-(carboxyamino)imidazole ribonucleotide synthase
VRLAPGAVIGILGGGQLGRMTALAAARLGYRTHVFAPESDGPAVQVTNRATIARYEDAAALARFARSVDVITIEFENLPLESLATLARATPMRPAPDVLAICQDRIREKAFLARIGVPTARNWTVHEARDLARANCRWSRASTPQPRGPGSAPRSACSKPGSTSPPRSR